MKFLVLWFVFVFSTTLTGPVYPKDDFSPFSLKLANSIQETPVWCWAAVTQQIIEFASNKHIPQCELVAAAKGIDSKVCCTGGKTCETGGNLLQIQYLIDQFSHRYSIIIRPQPAITMYNFLVGGNLIILQVQVDQNTRHALVLIGVFFDEKGRAQFIINDPLELVSKVVPYDDFKKIWLNTIVVLP